MTIRQAVTTCYALAILIVLSIHAVQTQALEYSVIAGLHVSHYGQQNYIDYKSEPKNTGRAIDNPTSDEYWLMEYDTVNYNQGTAQNNQLVGFKIDHNNYSYTLLTYKNSFYERSNGFCVNRVFKSGPNVSFEVGAMLVTGYRAALVMTDKEESLNQSPVLSPMFSMAYKITPTISLTYTSMGISAGVTGIQINL